jgi:hypothetical protein
MPYGLLAFCHLPHLYLSSVRPKKGDPLPIWRRASSLLLVSVPPLVQPPVSLLSLEMVSNYKDKITFMLQQTSHKSIYSGQEEAGPTLSTGGRPSYVSSPIMRNIGQ